MMRDLLVVGLVREVETLSDTLALWIHSLFTVFYAFITEIISYAQPVINPLFIRIR